MKGRVKFQVWSEAQQRWRTAYVRVEMLPDNIIHMTGCGMKFRVGDLP